MHLTVENKSDNLQHSFYDPRPPAVAFWTFAAKEYTQNKITKCIFLFLQ